MTLRDARVVLREPAGHDVEERLALGNPPEIVRMFGVDPATVPPLTEAAARRWVEALAGQPHAWVIEHARCLLGEVRLKQEGTAPKARLSIGLYDPAKLGMGLGRDAIRLVLAHAFTTLALRRVCLRVIAYNARAIRCYAACGFLEEGREREAAFVEGAWHDDVHMGLLAREFRPPGPKRAAV